MNRPAIRRPCPKLRCPTRHKRRPGRPRWANVGGCRRCLAGRSKTAAGYGGRAAKRDREKAKAEKQSKKEAKKRKIEERRIKAFRDYFDYEEDIKKIPPHRVLAINRGERAKVLRVRMEADLEAMYAADRRDCSSRRPSACRLPARLRPRCPEPVDPARLEREVRRELTDRAETHAVGVFARNLRNLLLQPPIHDRRVLAVDPGFKSGCKLAALDQFGNMLGHDVIYLIGSKPGRKEEAAQKVIDMIRKLRVDGGGHRQRHRLPRDRRFHRRDDRRRVEGPGRGLRDRQRGRGQRLLHQPHRPRRVPRVRRHAPRRDFHRPPPAGSAVRVGEDRPGQHRRGPVSARREGQAPAKPRWTKWSNRA